MPDLLELIKSRKTVRDYSNQDIPKDFINKIVEAARWAPSAHNLQPWKYVVVTNPGIISETANILNKKSLELFCGFNIIMKETAKKMTNSKALIFVYSDSAILKKFEKFGEPYSNCGSILEIQSVACSIMNALLCADSLGIGVAWLGITILCEKEINLLLSKKNKLMAVLSLGYPAKLTEPRTPRKEIEKMLEIIE